MFRFRMTVITGAYRRAASWLGEDRSVRISTGVFAVLGVAAVAVCSMMYLGSSPVPFVAPWFILSGTLAALVALIALVRDRNRHQLQARESSALANIGRIINLSPDFGDVFERFSAEVKKLVGFDRIVIVLVDIDLGVATFGYQHGQAVAGREGFYVYPLEGREVQRIVADGKSSIRADIAENPEFGADQVLLEAGLRSSARVPLIAKGRVIGTLNLHSFQVGTYGPREQVILEHLANQIAPTIENTKLYEQTRTAEKEAQERSNELSVLVDIASILTEPGDFLDKAKGVMEQLAEVADVEWATIRLPDQEGNLVLLVAAGSAINISSPIPLLSDRDHLAFTAFQESKTVVASEDLGIINRWASPALQDLVAGSLAFLPIKSQDRTLGLISFVSRQINHFTPELVRLLTAVAEGLGGLLENARLSQELHASTEEMGVVDEVARIITSTLDVDHVYDQFAGEVKKLVDFDRVVMSVIDQSNRTVILKYAAGLEIPGGEPGGVYPLDGSVSEQLIKTHDSIIRSNLPDNIRFGGIDQRRVDVGLRSTITVPLISSRRVVAALTFLSRSLDAYGVREQRILERLASQIAPAIENAELYEQTKSAEKEALERSDELSVLVDIASELSEPGEFLEKATGVMERLARVADVEWATLRLPNQDGDLALVVAAGSAIHSSPPRPVLTDRENVAYIAYHESRPIVVNNYPTETGRPASSLGLELGTPSPSFLKLGMKSMVLLPIRSGAQTLGLINLVSNKINHFTPELVKLMTAVADGVGAFLDNARLSQELHASTEQMAAVDEIARIITSTLDIDQVYDQFAAEVKKLVDFDRMAINAIDIVLEQFKILCLVGDDIPGRHTGDVIPLEGTQVQVVATTKKALIQNHPIEGGSYSKSERDINKLGLRSFIDVPLILRGVIVGSFTLRSKEENAYKAREQLILERLANQIAPAIGNATLFQETRRAQVEQERLAEENRVVAEIGRIVSSSLDITEVYDRVGQEIRELIPFDRMILSLIDGERSVVSPTWISGTDFPDRQREAQVPLAGSIAEMALQKRSPFMLEVGTEQDLIDRVPRLLPFFQAGMRSFLAVALSHRDDVVAELQLQSKELGIFSQVHLELAERIGNQIAGAVANAQLYEAQKISEEEERRAAVENKAMAEIGRIVSSSLDIDEVYQRLGNEVRNLIPFDRMGLSVVDVTEQTFTPTWETGLEVPGRSVGDVIPFAGSLAGEVSINNSAIMLTADSEEELHQRCPGLVPGFRAGLRSVLAVPLVDHDVVIGVLQMLSKEHNAYSQRHVDLAKRIGNQIAGSVANAQLYEDRKHAEEEARTSATESNTLAEIGKIISSSLEIDEVYARVTEEARKVIRFDRMSVSLVDYDHDESLQMYASGVDIPGRLRGDRTPLAGALAGEVALTRSSILFEAESEKEVLDRFPLLMPAFSSGLRSFISVPLVERDSVTGVFQLRSSELGIYGPRELAITERIAGQMSGALANARLYEESLLAQEEQRRLAQETSAMAEIGRIVSSSLDIDEVYQRLSEEVQKLIPFDRLSVTIINLSQDVGKPAYVAGTAIQGRQQGDIFPLAGTLAAEIARTRSGMKLEATSKAQLLQEFPGLLPSFRAGLKSFIAVPLINRQSVIGVLQIRSKQLGIFSDQHLDLAERIGNQIAGAIENGQLYEAQKQAEEEERLAAEENRVMAEIGRIISSSLDINEVYERLAEEVRGLIPFDRMGLSVIDEVEETSTPTWVNGLEIKGRHPGDVIPFAGSLAGEACLSKTAIRLDAAKQADLDQRFPGLMPAFRSGLRSFLAVPLMDHDIVLGVLQIRSKTPGIYDHRHLELAERIGAQIAGAISNAQLYEQTRQAEEAERQRSEELGSLLEVASILNNPDSFESKVSQVMEELSRICGADASANFRLPTDDGLMRIGSVGEQSTTGLLDYEGNIAALAYVQRKILVVNDYPNHPLALEENIQRGLKSALAAPVFSQESVVGVVIVSTLEPNHFNPERVSLLQGIINGLGSLLETARLEDERLQAEQELLESERRFRQISENMGQVVFLVTRQGDKFLYVNEAFEVIWGQPREKLYENPTCWFEALHPDDRVLFDAALEIQRQTGEFEAEYRIIRPDGTTRWIFDRTFPIQDESGEVHRLVGIAEDITERKQNEERMHETARLASIGELAAGVAHEINNPLTSVLGFSQLLLGEDLPEQAHSDIQRILSEAQRAAKVVQNLLSFARKRPSEARYMPIGPIMERVLELKAYDFRLHDIETDITIPDDLPETMVDEYQLIQVLLNLLNNSEHAVQEVSEPRLITIRVIQAQDQLRISVADNGPGIPEENLGKIFEPFFTTKEVGVGTGLGLSTCYGIVRQHGGKMWVENGEQGGATFFFELPVVGPSSGIEPEASEFTPGPRTTKHLLVVDDEPGIRDLLHRTLELAENGEQAWDKICQRNYDCIIMDLKMPGMSGPELFHEIEGTGEDEAARVIFITGDTLSSDTSAFVSSVKNPVLN